MVIISAYIIRRFIEQYFLALRQSTDERNERSKRLLEAENEAMRELKTKRVMAAKA